jgi:hypothetical protein
MKISAPLTVQLRTAQVTSPDSQDAVSMHKFEQVRPRVEQLKAAVTASKNQLAGQKAAFDHQHSLCKVCTQYSP